MSLVLDPPQSSSILNRAAARVLDGSPHGRGMMTVLLALGPEGDGARILARITRRSWDELRLAPGRPVFAQIKGVALLSPPHPDAEG